MSNPVFKPNLKAEPWKTYADQARAHWGRSTAFRLGHFAGRAGEATPNPYSFARNREMYQDGYKHGVASITAEQSKKEPGL